MASVYYFAHFFLVLPFLSCYEKSLPLPDTLLTAQKGRRQNDHGQKASLPSTKIVIFFLVTAGSQWIGIGDGWSGEGKAPPKEKWTFASPVGTFDRADLQRGFQVFEEVCASCHGLDHVSFLKLKALGYKENEIKAIAAKKEVFDGVDGEGNPIKRPGRPSDLIQSPYINEEAARAANNGALPPDLSLMVKARKGGADYLHALLTGYSTCPDGVSLAPGMYYNVYFSGHQIAMPAPLSDGLITYADGTRATVDQMSRDVTTFLAWTAEPELEERRQIGVRVLLYLCVFTVIMFLVMRRIWRRVDRRGAA